MKANPTEQEPETFEYVADIMSCVIRCLPYIIRERAYQLFEARGRQPGHEFDDWLQAEREIKHHSSSTFAFEITSQKVNNMTSITNNTTPMSWIYETENDMPQNHRHRREVRCHSNNDPD